MAEANVLLTAVTGQIGELLPLLAVVVGAAGAIWGGLLVVGFALRFIRKVSK